MNDDDEELDLTEAERAWLTSLTVERSIKLLSQALRMNDWSEMSHEEREEDGDDFIVIEADGRSTIKVEEVLSDLEYARDEYIR